MHFRCGSVRLSYRSLLEKYNILNLSSRRLQLDIIELYDLHHNKYDITAFIGMLCYRVPYRAQQKEARPHQLFGINRCRIVAGIRSPTRPLVDTCNTHFNAIDIIASTVEAFRKNILKS
ncbi:hypothetical protein EVAR_74633_1 [Eumeta japonica]|uniref:Uncharacterized protein n=1 Tax=Eumeta variegata TaxID=151549 RepID=A0A4C1W9R5_EUMVA|nr:hypothetical protein EVAR_74633_1 [Eumeta japonica]